MPNVKYPYLPKGKVVLYVPATHRCMVVARQLAQRQSLDKVMPTASLILAGNTVIGSGVNGSNFHEKNPCQRVALDCKTGEGYELCEGCHPKNHSERKAIQDAQSKGHDTKDTDLYLWGHWWCCQLCWEAITDAEITNVFLVKNSEILFNKEHPDNIVGRQFA